MPAEGIELKQRSEIFTWEELIRLVEIFVEIGIKKLRITGGEPFQREGLLPFLQRVRAISGLESIHITTNGVRVAPFVSQLSEIGISSINLSLDTLDRHRFVHMTRRDVLDEVLATMNALLKNSVPLKINMVVIEEFNSDEIIAMTQLAKDHPVEVRFIEEMPFHRLEKITSSDWNVQRLLHLLRSSYPDMNLLSTPNSTAQCFAVPGFVGRIGVIAAHSRSFCSSCNRIRVAASGQLKTCLYDKGVLNLKSMLRSGASNGQIQTAIKNCIRDRFVDGFEAYAKRGQQGTESMMAIGG
jgi:cyclic pyranopterin phosphate synthase